MTAHADRRAVEGGPVADTDTSAPHLPVAELALVGVTTAAVFSLSRLFQDWSFFWPLVAVLAYSHVVTLVLRRRGVGVATSAVIATIGFVVLASWLWFASSTLYGIPAPGTWTAFTTAVHDSWSAFQQLTAPVPAQAGFVVAAALAVFFAVFLADWAAFRLWSPVESIIPALTLFLFSTLLGSERQRMASAFAFCAATLVYLLAHRVARLETSSGWLTADIERGSRWLLRAGAALSAVAVLGGVIIGPRLPSANDDAIVEFRQGDRSGPSSRVTVSPLVNIHGRLVDQKDVTVFTVRSPTKAYWRLTALDTFDGQIWRSGGSYQDADGDLGANRPSGVSVEQVDQDYDIAQLSAIWLPAAFQPVHIDTEGVPSRYEDESSTLIVDTDYQNSDSVQYHVVSEIPTPTTDELMAAEQEPGDDMAPYLELPDDFSSKARELADQVVATAQVSDQYGKARALQDFFRDQGVFENDGTTWTYDLDPPEIGHDVAAIDAFLDSHRGYCEMYAGTYAAMARSIGLPARVAVGFTWGDQDPDDPETYTVKGEHAHAWPEVWLGDQIGWIAFEPTPDRGAPGMADYAGVQEQQVDESADPSATTSTTSTTAPTTSSTTQSSTSQDDLSALLGTDAATSTGGGGDGTSWVIKLGVAALALLVAVLLYALGALAYTAWWRHRRRERAVEPGSRVALAWTESLEDLELVGVVRAGDETHVEFARRAGAAVPTTGTALDDLAGLADVATFAPDAVDEAAADRAGDAAASIADTVHARVSPRERWLRRIDPRRLLRSAGASSRQQAHSSRG
jgi:transglutaminase-like putative cysteine protease